MVKLKYVTLKFSQRYPHFIRINAVTEHLLNHTSLKFIEVFIKGKDLARSIIQKQVLNLQFSWWNIGKPNSVDPQPVFRFLFNLLYLSDHFSIVCLFVYQKTCPDDFSKLLVQYYIRNDHYLIVNIIVIFPVQY